MKYFSMSTVFTGSAFGGFILSLLCQTVALAADPAAVIVRVSGDSEVSVLKTGKSKPEPLKIKDELFAGDKVITSANQTIVLQFTENSEVVIGPSSSFLIEEYQFAASTQRTVLQLFYGMLRALVNRHYDSKDEAFTVRTRSGVMGVRGTEFIVEADSQTHVTTLHTIEGSVAIAATPEGLRSPSAVLVGAGFSSAIAPDMKVPSPPKAFEVQKLHERLKGKSADFDKAVTHNSRPNGVFAKPAHRNLLRKGMEDPNAAKNHSDSQTAQERAEISKKNAAKEEGSALLQPNVNAVVQPVPISGSGPSTQMLTNPNAGAVVKTVSPPSVPTAIKALPPKPPGTSAGSNTSGKR
jgi:hypothetical protein